MSPRRKVGDSARQRTLLKEQPENYYLIGDLALVKGSRDKAAALALSERAMAAVPIERRGVWSRCGEVLARVAAQMGEPGRAIAALQKLLSIPGNGPLAENVSLTCAAPARSDVRSAPNDPRFQNLRGKAAVNLRDAVGLWMPTGEQSGLLAHRGDGERYVTHADEKLTAFLELEAATWTHSLGRTYE